MTFRSRRLLVEVRHEHASYTLVDGDPLEITHHGQRATIEREEPLVLAIPQAPVRERPRQPRGREPARRRNTR